MAAFAGIIRSIRDSIVVNVTLLETGSVNQRYRFVEMEGSLTLLPHE